MCSGGGLILTVLRLGTCTLFLLFVPSSSSSRKVVFFGRYTFHAIRHTPPLRRHVGHSLLIAQYEEKETRTTNEFAKRQVGWQRAWQHQSSAKQHEFSCKFPRELPVSERSDNKGMLLFAEGRPAWVRLIEPKSSSEERF